MSKSLQPNPYRATDLSENRAPAIYRWLNWFVCGACLYYFLSAVTLPFASKAWVGEVPILGILQLPKSFLKFVLHDVLLLAVHQFGWSKGSASPDYGMIHPWAMVLMLAVPALLLSGTILYCRSGKTRAFLLISVLAFAFLDALVTLWFETSSSLKLYNASFY